MNQAMKKAKETFAQGNYTCVWCRDDELLTSKEAGLRPLLTRIREGKDLNGFYAADKIVGRAATFLYVKPDYVQWNAQFHPAAVRKQRMLPFWKRSEKCSRNKR